MIQCNPVFPAAFVSCVGLTRGSAPHTSPSRRRRLKDGEGRGIGATVTVTVTACSRKLLMQDVPKAVAGGALRTVRQGFWRTDAQLREIPG